MAGEEASKYIDAGDIARAEEVITDGPAESNLLARARLTSDGLLAAKRLNKALASAEHSAKPRIIHLIIDYHIAAGEYGVASENIERFLRDFPKDTLRAAVLQRKIMIAERRKDIPGARKVADAMSQSAIPDNWRDWANCASARLQISVTGASKSALKSAREKIAGFAAQSSGNVSAQALYFMAKDQAKYGDIDRATLHYNILREAYPNAIGLSDLAKTIAKLVVLPTGEKRKGAFYAIQVGVFGDKKNANKQKDRFKSGGEVIDVIKRSSDGKNIYAVWVGKFATYDSAMAYKRSLERSANELFTIIVR